MRAPREPFWYVAGACAVALVVLIVVLFLVPAPAPAPTVTVESIHWQVKQQAPTNGTPEYAEQWINQSGSIWGFPLTVAPGGTFNDSLVLISQVPFDSYLCGVTVAPPLVLLGNFPSFPMVLRHEEDNTFTLTLGVDASGGTTIAGMGVVDAVTCGVPS